MALFAFFGLTIYFVKLLWEQGPQAAVDLKFRYNEVQLWFAGSSVYTERRSEELWWFVLAAPFVTLYGASESAVP